LLRNRSRWGAVGLGEGLGQQPTEPDVVLGHEHLPAARAGGDITATSPGTLS
jgi:predicted phosphodiesterase